MTTTTSTPDLDAFVSQGWTDHERDSAGVLARLPDALPLVTAPAHVATLTALLVHVAGEHLGRWHDGLALLERVAALSVVAPGSAEDQAVARGRATLLLCAGDRAGADALLARAHPAGLPEGSTRARVLAVAASALAGQRRIDEALVLFDEALRVADYGPAKDDPAARALAVTGNNLACALEERPGRTAAEDRLLELAARTGRRFWEVAGGWTQVERAEYRLAMTFVALGRAQDALTHARACLSLCEANGADAGELFFAHEALARAHHAVGDAAAARAACARMAELQATLDPSLADYAREVSAKVDALLTAG
jgi:tetratricopeptide (TPR) repeat protein